MNKLFYGDNLDVMRKFIRDLGGLIFVISIRRSIPNVGYNQISTTSAPPRPRNAATPPQIGGGADRAQAPLVTDTWTWDDHANQCYEEILSNKNGVQTQHSIALINGLEKVLGKGSLFT